MGNFDSHFSLYKRFKKDAENEDNFEGTRVEAFFLSAYHLIEACSARERIHINKHQKVRATLTENPFIIGDDTEEVWRSFQRIENQLRPKFAYALSWNLEDLKEVKRNFESIEGICLKVLA
jgi:hypothetical protein